jgi:hypothetical protein
MIHSPIQAKYLELGMRADDDSGRPDKTGRKAFERSLTWILKSN